MSCSAIGQPLMSEILKHLATAFKVLKAVAIFDLTWEDMEVLSNTQYFKW